MRKELEMRYYYVQCVSPSFLLFLLATTLILLPSNHTGQSQAASISTQDIKQEDIICPVRHCGPIFFSSKSSQLNEDARACLEETAQRLRLIPEYSVVIDGHRDMEEGDSLSIKRIKAARDYLIKQKKVDQSRIKLRYYGSSCPHPSGDVELNRRVEFWFLAEGQGFEAVYKECRSGAAPKFRELE